jgi:hypothetical protein
MKLSLTVKYSKLPQDVKTPEDLSRFLITESVGRRYPQGMPRTESRIYAKLLDQFYEEKNYLEIDEPTFLLIKESLDQTNLPAHFSSWKWALLDHLGKCAEKNKKDS